MNNSSDNYEDIIDLPHHVSEKHPQMSRHDRAAQFSPFAALTGHDEAIEETARLTDTKQELTAEQADKLNRCLQLLSERQQERPLITAEYFIPDTKKSGGAYVKYTGNFRRFDGCNNDLIFTDGCVISIEDIYELTGEIFSFDQTGE